MELEAFCSFPWTRVRVTAEGNIAMCCFQRPDDDEPDKIPYIGNILESTFDDIWFGDDAEDIRNEILSGKLHSKCQCPGCPYLRMSVRSKREFIYNEYPTALEIDLANTECNVGGAHPSASSPACIMCERASPRFKPDNNLIFQVLPRLINLLPNLELLHIQGNAEPFWNNLIFDVLDNLGFEKFKHQITVSTMTNGMFFDDPLIIKWLNLAPHSVTTFSLDAATPETYKKIRIIDCYDSVVQNLLNFSRQRVSRRQFVQIHNNINVINLHEVIGMCEVAHQAKVDMLEFAPTAGFNKEIVVNKSNCGKFAKAQLDIAEYCHEKKVPLSFSRSLDMGLCNGLSQLLL
jgi:MoaA/NifB/PqqE/SkfB family radical SAM enzyme